MEMASHCRTGDQSLTRLNNVLNGPDPTTIDDGASDHADTPLEKVAFDTPSGTLAVNAGNEDFPRPARFAFFCLSAPCPLRTTLPSHCLSSWRQFVEQRIVSPACGLAR
jgi:hypothetical protein